MHVFKLKNNRLNNRDINIDQNNRDYDFSHNRAALGRQSFFAAPKAGHSLPLL